MKIDLAPFFQRYERIVHKVDEMFDRMKEKYPDEIRCDSGCTECCYGLFDLTLIEAVYVNFHFHRIFTGPSKETLLEKANRIDRQTYKIKKAAFKAQQQGKDEDAIMEEVARQRVRCALLNEDNRCDLYAFRPIACRIDGIPAAVAGKGRTCPQSGFRAGQTYPTVNRDVLQRQLLTLSAELVASIPTKYTRMGDVLVPLSMALITDYDDAYFGISDAPDAGETPGQEDSP